MFDKELLDVFIVEVGEHLNNLDTFLLLLEDNPEDEDVIKSVFRSIHTIKGSSGMFELKRLEKVAHKAEDILSFIRDGKLPVTNSTITTLLEAVDIFVLIIDHLKENLVEPEGDDTIILGKLDAILNGDSNDESSADEEVTSEVENTETVEASEEVVIESSELQSEELPAPIVSSKPEQDTTALNKAKASDPSGDTTLRVKVSILDQLMNHVGELVLARNQLVELAKGEDESKFFLPIQQLNKITSEMQESVVQTRMQPIGNAWAKLPRIVRDLENISSKKINLVMEGKETEIDRQILQAIQDPIIHCVRNSADHGIESKEERAASGKSEVGTIELSASQEGGYIVIELKDDGKGIDVKRVREKVLENGMLSEDQISKLNDQQIINYIFEPGFSTAKEVTNVSGRGVGMDVVKTSIESIGGSVNIQTEFGKGTNLQIKIPLTLAIISGLIVKIGENEEDKFAIPQNGIVELVHVDEENMDLIESINGGRVLKLRDELIPLFDLGKVIDSRDSFAESDNYSIVVAQVEGKQFGLCVDEIFDTQEIVVKPAGRIIREVNLFSGTTILGNGDIVIIFDLTKLMEGLEIEKSYEDGLGRDNSEFDGKELVSMLFFEGSSDESPMAVPLSLVSRIEEFKKSDIEKVDGELVVQYRGDLLNLQKVKPSLDIDSIEGDNFSALIFSDNDRQMGLVVGKVLDIENDRFEMKNSSNGAGVIGTCIMQGKATEIIDVYYYLKQSFPNWFKLKSDDAEKKKILLLEDSKFFADVIKPFLEGVGYDVTHVENGRLGLSELESGKKFNLILSDIEMPEMDGIAFAKAVGNSNYSTIPMVALSSLNDEHTDAILEAGFLERLHKFDKDTVLECVNKHII